MAFLIEASDASVQQAIRRIAAEQMDAALAEAESADGQTTKAIHSVRKRCKRIRGLLRLVRGAFPADRAENAAVRDAAAGLAPFRDADVLTDTFNKAAGQLQGRIDEAAISGFREALSARAQRLKEGLDEAGALAEFHAAMAAIRRRVEGWTLERDGFDAMREGLASVYRRARRDMRLIPRDPSSENFHDWRKQVKYHFYQLCLLRGIAPHMLTSQRDLANELGELLGDHHDIAVFLQVLDDEPELTAGLSGVGMVRTVLGARQDELGGRTLLLGHELAGERTVCLVERLESYWKFWRRTQGEVLGPGNRTQVPRAA